MDVVQQPSHHFHHTPTWYERAYANGPPRSPANNVLPEARQSFRNVQHGTFKQRVQQIHQRCSNAAGAPVVSVAIPRQHTSTILDQDVEHMLRRKTPNGTLVGGYDGRPSGWNTQKHPNKHVMISAPTIEQDISSQAFANTGTLSGQSGQLNLHSTDPTACPLNPQFMLNDFHPSKPKIATRSRYQQHGGTSAIFPAPSAGMDSVLHQQPFSQTWRNVPADQYIPTALQPMWPPCVGATSRNAPDPTGPYWPDGSNDPYRPTPFPPTDLLHRNNADDSLYAIPQHQRTPLSKVTHQHAHGRYTGDPFVAYPDRDFIGQRPLHGADNPPHVRIHNSQISTQADFGPDIVDGVTESVVDPDSKDITVIAREHYDTSNETQFKERVLAWAHRVYLSLVTTSDSLPRISPISQSSTQPRLHYHPYVHTHVYGRQLVPQSCRKTYSDHVQSRMIRRASDAYQGQAVQTPCCTDDKTVASSSFRGLPYRVRNLSLVHQSAGDRYERPAATAVTALEMLGRLCQQSNWEWNGGMLLGGCLAFALRDYNSAQKWYTRLLSAESNNVEAISNLAATCVALHKPQEAEALWNRAVKLRPDFFEAVEHLVGLYCEDRRPREAVKVIAFVQASLRKQENQPLASGSNPSGYNICRHDNGRLIALLHGKGNMLYALGDNVGAAKAFEDAILVGCGQTEYGVEGLIVRILNHFSGQLGARRDMLHDVRSIDEPVLLDPKMARRTSRLLFPPTGDLPGLGGIGEDAAKKSSVSIVSNSLLSLAKIYQDGMSSTGASFEGPRAASGVRDILSLYYLSLSLQPSPSTANNVGILLAGIQQSSATAPILAEDDPSEIVMPGVVAGSGIWLALKYYRFGLELDHRHAHLYTNLGSLFKDMGHLAAAITMYQKAVDCDGNFDIALANLANAVKDQGRISDAISFYQRAVKSNPDFAEAVCGLSNALNSVCDWTGRGGIKLAGRTKDRWHIDDKGMLHDAKMFCLNSSGWIARVVAIVEKQLRDGETWGKGVLNDHEQERILRQLLAKCGFDRSRKDEISTLEQWLKGSSNIAWEGARVVRLIERATKRISWRAYRKRYFESEAPSDSELRRPELPAALTVPGAPTVLPFHTFTCPLDARQIRRISQRNGLRISCSTLKAPWLPTRVYEAPPPPRPHLNVGYVSSDFNNHPLAHLMQSVFGLHDQGRVKAFCYATTASDGSIHRQQIEREAPVFYDASSWSAETLVSRIIDDQIHILVNLNGYTRGARNEIFAARPSPIQMSFMGFAGTLGAEWCDYLLADKVAVPPSTLRPYRQNVDVLDICHDGNNNSEFDEWMYGENIIFTRDTFFCCDHRQSAPDAKMPRLTWTAEQERRWRMRKELFPDLPDNVVILANFNQLYKIDPGTLRTWLRILSRVPKAILWLLRFPELGEQNLRQTALRWAGSEVASRIVFTDVAPKHEHITRAAICDLFLDTPECNAHTTAADILWSGTPLLTLPKYDFKMCSRMAASILRGALPKTAAGDQAASSLTVSSEDEYEERAVELASGLVYPSINQGGGTGTGQLTELRRVLYESRWTSALFDTRRWVRDLEEAYDQAWLRWDSGHGGDIML